MEKYEINMKNGQLLRAEHVPTKDLLKQLQDEEQRFLKMFDHLLPTKKIPVMKAAAVEKSLPLTLTRKDKKPCYPIEDAQQVNTCIITDKKKRKKKRKS